MVAQDILVGGRGKQMCSRPIWSTQWMSGSQCYIVNLISKEKLSVVTFNPNTQETETGRSLSLKIARTAQRNNVLKEKKDLQAQVKARCQAWHFELDPWAHTRWKERIKFLRVVLWLTCMQDMHSHAHTHKHNKQTIIKKKRYSCHVMLLLGFYHANRHRVPRTIHFYLLADPWWPASSFFLWIYLLWYVYIESCACHFVIGLYG